MITSNKWQKTVGILQLNISAALIIHFVFLLLTVKNFLFLITVPFYSVYILTNTILAFTKTKPNAKIIGSFILFIVLLTILLIALYTNAFDYIEGGNDVLRVFTLISYLTVAIVVLILFLAIVIISFFEKAKLRKNEL